MMKKPASSPSVLRTWLRPRTYWDGWFDLLERSRRAVGRLLDFAYLLRDRAAYKRRPSYFPQVEGLEVRLLMTSAVFANETASVAYNGTLEVQVVLQGGSDSEVTVDYATEDVSAISELDYAGASGTLTFPAYETTASFYVSMWNNPHSSTRYFYIHLSNPSGCGLGSPASETVAILGPPIMTLKAATQQVNYNLTAIIEADLNHSSLDTITVHYATADDTAIAGTDYTAASGTLTILPGATSATLNMPLRGRQQSSNRAFNFTLSSPSNAYLSATSGTVTDTITDAVTIVNQPSLAVDARTNITLPMNVPINSFSGWNMDLRAQNAGAGVTAYSWDFSGAAEASSIHNASTYHPTFTWSSFSGAARTETIKLIETTTGGGQQTQTFTFLVASTSSKATDTQPSAITWPTVIAPDQLKSQPMVPAGPYAVVGLVDGSLQTATGLPTYNPNALPVSLVYNSAIAHPVPTFIINLLLDPTKSTPTQITAQLKVDNTTESTVYFNPSLLNPGDYTQIALQAASLPTTMTTGRYSWQVVTTISYNSNVVTTYTGSFDYIKGSTTPTTAGSPAVDSPFGTGWSLANVSHLWAVSGGVILQNPDGTSLWFATNGGGYDSPKGDFSTLTYGSSVYTRTLPDGTQVKYDSAGKQTNIIDRNSNITTFSYNGSDQLTTITDATLQYTTITYTSNRASSIVEPGPTTLTFSYSSGNLITVVDPNTYTWTYGYDGSARLTTIKDPRYTSNNYTTTFSYAANQASTVNQPDGSTKTIAPGQLAGLAPAGTGTSSGNKAASALAAFARASYTDPNSQTWDVYTDGLGYGLPVESADPLGDTSLTYRDDKGLPWLMADPLGHRERLFFDSQGNVPTVVYADDSYSTASSFNSFGEPAEVVDAMGGVTDYSYDGNGNLTELDDANGHNTSFSYMTGTHVSGLLQSVTQPLNATNSGLYITTFAYDSLDRMTTMTQALTATTLTGAASNGGPNLIRLTLASTAGLATGNSLTVASVGGMTEANGTWTITLIDSTHVDLQASSFSHTYTSGGTANVNLSQVWSYDAISDVATFKDRASHTTTFSYDALGNLLTEVLPINAGVNATYTYSYGKVSNLATATDPLSAVTSYSYDAMNRLTKVEDPLHNVTTYVYDSAANLTGVVNALTYTTTFVYDNASQLIAVTIPLAAGSSATTTYTLDAAGETTAVKDALSHTTTYTYNSRGWLATAIYPLGNSASYGYNAVGDVTTHTLKDTSNNLFTSTATYLYDHLLLATTDAAGFKTTYSYDNNNRLDQVAGPNFNRQISLDALSRAAALTLGESAITTNTMDSAGNVTSSIDANGNTSTASYDYQGRLLSSTDGLGKTTTFTYDLVGRLTSLTDPNTNATNYAYNADGWLTTATNANGYTATYSYDAIGELTDMTDFASRRTTFTYNRAGWQTGETSVSGSYIATYTYDAVGEMTVAKDSNSTYSYTYDNNGQLTKTKVSYPGASGMGTVTLDYTYDGFGHRKTLTDSGSASITYGYNNNFQMTTLNFAVGSTHANLAFAYNADDALGTMTMGGGSDTITAVYGYAGSVSIIYSDTSANSLPTCKYTMSNGESQISRYDGPQGSSGFNDGTLTYTYDAGGQLTGVTGGETYTYNYDSNGDRTTMVDSATTTYSIGTGNQLTSDGTYSYTYDHNGNLATKYKGDHSLTITYGWDYHNRLTQVAQTGTGTFTEDFTYDVFGNLIGAKLGGTLQRSTVYDGKNAYIDFDGSGNLDTRYLTNPDGLNQFYGRVVDSSSNTVHTVGWFITDLTGSIREIVTGSGTIVDKINYDAFGNVLYESSPSDGGRFKFQAGEWDSNAKLYRFGDRWQDPVTGRWISQDPIGFAAGDANLYRYVGNAPINNVDPTGHDVQMAMNAMAAMPGDDRGGAGNPGSGGPRAGLGPIFGSGGPGAAGRGQPWASNVYQGATSIIQAGGESGTLAIHPTITAQLGNIPPFPNLRFRGVDPALFPSREEYLRAELRKLDGKINELAAARAQWSALMYDMAEVLFVLGWAQPNTFFALDQNWRAASGRLLDAFNALTDISVQIGVLEQYQAQLMWELQLLTSPVPGTPMDPSSGSPNIT